MDVVLIVAVVVIVKTKPKNYH